MSVTVTNAANRLALLSKVPGQVFLCAAALILGTSSTVTRKLTTLGAQHLVEGHNPISLCNVLFIGNLCALIVLLILYWRQFTPAILKQLSRREKLGLVAVSILTGAVAPGLFFQALAQTNVSNIVLVGRLEPPLMLALSVWVLKERIDFWTIAGALVAFAGVALTIFLQPATETMMHAGGFTIGVGELLTALAAIASAIAAVLNKKYLKQVSVGLYSIVRTALGTIVFFFAALLIYGDHHFMEALSPFLWIWMLVYGTAIVVVGQSFWFIGVRTASVSATALVASFTPVIGILSAYIILREEPTNAQYIGGSVILVGILLGQVGAQRRRKFAELSATDRQKKSKIQQQTLDSMGFKGI